jgi:DNA-binding Lrp family transcriptional regulator
MRDETTTTTSILDNTDLQIIRLLSRDSRISFRSIASTVGISLNAVRARINKMMANHIIQGFTVRVDPLILGYDRECYLTIRYPSAHVSTSINTNTNTLIKEEDVIKRLSLLGEVLVLAKQLGGDSIVILAAKAGVENKIELLTDLLKPAVVESRVLSQKPLRMAITLSDFKIIKSLLSDARKEIADIAKQCSISKRTVTRRIDQMRQNHILEFTILRDLSTMQLVGYVEFAVMINVDRSLYLYVLKRIYRELQEYLIFIPNATQYEVIFAVFFCANIPTVDSILTTIRSFDGVRQAEIFITTKLVIFDEWLKREINNRLKKLEEKGAVSRQKKKNIVKLR